MKNLALRNEYRQNNLWCELHRHFPLRFPETDAHEVHHIWSLHQRPDLLSNLLAVSRDAHEWCEAHKTDGRIAALWAKHAKGELDPEEFRRASGYFLAGWLDMVDTQCEWLAEPLAILRKVYAV